MTRTSASRRRLWGAAIFVLALALRLAYVHEHHAVLDLDVSKLPQTDNHVFVEWARIIAGGDLLCRDQPHAYHLWTQDVAPEGRWLEWYGGARTFHQSPLYAYFVATIFGVLGDEHALVGYVQGLIGALTCLLTFVLASRLISLRAGVVAGLLLAFYGGFYFYDAFVLRDGVMAVLVVALALTLDAAVQRRRAIDWLIAGATLGLFTLAKETGLALLGLSLIGIVIAWRHAPATAARAAGLLVVGWIAVASPAFIRNHIVDAPTFRLSTRGPEVFIAGNARGEDGISWDPRAAVLRDILTESNFSLPKTMALTLATHRADPPGYLGLLWDKTEAFFNGYEVPNNVNFYLNRSHLTSLQLGIVSMTFLGPAALLGLLLAIPRRRRLAVPYLLTGALIGSVVMLYILARFRLQALPLLAFFAAYAVDWAASAFTARHWGKLTAATALFAVLVVWAWPPATAFTDLNKNAAIMLMHIKTGNFEQARRYRELQNQAIATIDPDTLDESLEWKLQAIEDAFVAFDVAMTRPEGSVDYHMQLANGYSALLPASKRGEKIELTNLAVDNYRRALELDPEVEGAHHGLGTVYGRNDDSHRALSEFTAELNLHPEHGPSHRDAGLILFAWNDLLRALVHFDYAIVAGYGDARVMACAARVHIDKTYQDQTLPSGLPAYDEPLGWARADAALRLDPTDPLVLEHAATVYYARGDSQGDPTWIVKAIDMLETLTELQPWRAEFIRNRIDVFSLALAPPDEAAHLDEAPAVGSEPEPDPDLPTDER